MPFLYTLVVAGFIFLEPVLLVLTYASPDLFGRDEIWAIQGPCVLLMPFSASLWWTTLRHITGHRGGFQAPLIVFVLTAAVIVCWRLL